MIRVTLPWPPSQNRIWRRGKSVTYLSSQYRAWIEEAGWAIRQQTRGFKPIVGRFRAEILLNPPDNRQRDIDNSVKVLLDIAQKHGLVANDRYCEDLHVVLDRGSSTTPVGASLTLTAMSS